MLMVHLLAKRQSGSSQCLVSRTGSTSVVFPDGLTKIGERAFWCCTEITSVVFPESFPFTHSAGPLILCWPAQGGRPIADKMSGGDYDSEAKIDTVSAGAAFTCVEQ